MPVNLKMVTVVPDPEGNIIIVTQDGEVVKGNLVMSSDSKAVTGHTSHFATCPQAQNWRQK